MKIIFTLILFLSFWSSSNATQQIQEVNYFASLRSNETNVRSGPGANYPIKHSFKIKNLPIKVISEYDNWCEIEDYEGSRGWIAQNLITKKRFLLTYSKNKITEFYTKKDANSRKIYHLENFIIAEYLKCEGSWCQVKINDKKGYILSSELFGVDEI